MRDDALTDVAWVRTDQGDVTVADAFKHGSDLNLSTSVPGYVYSSQHRFLMTIFPLLVKTAGSWNAIKGPTVDTVLTSLERWSHLHDQENPFMQLPRRLYHPLVGDDEGTPSLPSRMTPTDVNVDQDVFWDLRGSAGATTPASVLALVVSYFFQTGTNLYHVPEKLQKAGLVAKAERRRLTNFSSGLRYVSSKASGSAVEVVPIGDNLLETLALATPKSFLNDTGAGLLPHWADRDGTTVARDGQPTGLWSFSWAGNAVAARWKDEGRLSAIGLAGAPPQWLPGVVAADAKRFHDTRSVADPLYFYLTGRNGKRSLKLLDMSSDPYYTVAVWMKEQYYQELRDRWAKNICTGHPDHVLFLEHATEGAAGSFMIRRSQVTVVDDLAQVLPDGHVAAMVSDQSATVVEVGRLLSGMFSEKGTMKHLAPMQREVKNTYWGGCQDLVDAVVHGGVTNEQATEMARQAALAALRSVSSTRDTAHLAAHLHAENKIRWCLRTKEESR